MKLNHLTFLQKIKKSLNTFPLLLIVLRFFWSALKRVGACSTKFGFKLAQTSDLQKVKELINELSPRKTGYELIRLGGDGDGGYLLPNCLDGVVACFSPGVSNTADFEYELAERGVKCYLADYSVEAPPLSHKNFDFIKKYIGISSDDIYITLDDWVSNANLPNGELILQMDIEGGEYDVILDSSDETLKKFKIIVIEFHFMDCINEVFGYELIKLTFRKLLKHFYIIHIHPNNSAKPVKYGNLMLPPFLEFTFIRKDIARDCGPQLDLPHPLDRPNNVNKENFTLPSCWLR